MWDAREVGVLNREANGETQQKSQSMPQRFIVERRTRLTLTDVRNERGAQRGTDRGPLTHDAPFTLNLTPYEYKKATPEAGGCLRAPPQQYDRCWRSGRTVG